MPATTFKIFFQCFILTRKQILISYLFHDKFAEKTTIELRIQAIKNGTVKPVPSAEVAARIRARHGF